MKIRSLKVSFDDVLADRFHLGDCLLGEDGRTYVVRSISPMGRWLLLDEADGDRPSIGNVRVTEAQRRL